MMCSAVSHLLTPARLAYLFFVWQSASLVCSLLPKPCLFCDVCQSLFMPVSSTCASGNHMNGSGCETGNRKKSYSVFALPVEASLIGPPQCACRDVHAFAWCAVQVLHPPHEGARHTAGLLRCLQPACAPGAAASSVKWQHRHGHTHRNSSGTAAAAADSSTPSGCQWTDGCRGSHTSSSSSSSRVACAGTA
jgi:hypothetical protein